MNLNHEESPAVLDAPVENEDDERQKSETEEILANPTADKAGKPKKDNNNGTAQALRKQPPKLKKRRKQKNTPDLSRQEIAEMISRGELTELELMARNHLDKAETNSLIFGIVAGYRVDLKPEFFDAVYGAALPPDISKLLGAAEDSIVKYRKVDGGVLLRLAV